MPKPEWGSKHLCQSCGAKFYDLQRNPITCPACGTAFDPEATTRTKRSRSTSAKPVKETTTKAADDLVEVDDDFETDDDDVGDDDSLLVDDDDLDDDDEDISGIKAGKDDED